MRPRPLLPEWLAICDRLRDAVTDAGGGDPEFRAALALASIAVVNGAEDADEVIREAVELCSDPARVAEILQSQSRETQARQSRASLRRAGNENAGQPKPKRAGSPHASHRSNSRRPGQRWDMEDDEDLE